MKKLISLDAKDGKRKASVVGTMGSSWNNGPLPIDPLHFLENHTGTGLYLLDIATNRMSWSEGVYSLLNVAKGEIEPSRQAIRDMVHPKDRRPIEEMDRLFASGTPFQIEHRIITRDRRLRWISNRAEFLFAPSGEPATVIGVFQDTSALHQAQDLAAEYSKRMEMLLQLGVAVSWTAAPDGNLTSIPDWETVFGGSDEPTGMKMFEIIHPDDRERSRVDWETALKSGENYISEHRILSPDGDYRWRRCSALPVRSESNAIRNWLGITIDIHAEKSGESIRGRSDLVTGAQLRAARSILRLSVRDLADMTGVAPSTIRRLEDNDGLSHHDRTTTVQLKSEMERRGITFLFPKGMKPAVSPS